MSIQTFWLEPVAQARLSLRRFVYSSDAKCSGPWGYHNAEVVIGDIEEPLRPAEDRYERLAPPASEYVGDGRWPTQCSCGYVFTDADHWQVNRERLYVGAPDGQLHTLHSAPIGAMWDAWWMGEHWRGADGIALVVRCPGGADWAVDGRANNCTLPHDNIHKCWIRHGDPRLATLTVDKNGVTCQAGAGSIQTSNWHGFLRNGILA